MGTPWCAHLPVVSIPRTIPPTKAVTLIVPYYENPTFLATQVAWWRSLPALLRINLRFIVVDDGSPKTPARDVLAGVDDFSLRLFRIETDIRWNWLAARNIGAHEAETTWLVLTDMDHQVPVDTWRGVLHADHRPDTIYAFSRKEHTGQSITAHPNSWLITKELFWTVGGYDETLSGHYGTDGDWRRRCAATARMAVLAEPLIRHEFVDDASTTTYKRKQPEDAAVKRLIAQRGSGWRPKVLRVPYHEEPIHAAATV
jgi:hypothetical protein